MEATRNARGKSSEERKNRHFFLACVFCALLFCLLLGAWAGVVMISATVNNAAPVVSDENVSPSNWFGSGDLILGFKCSDPNSIGDFNRANARITGANNADLNGILYVVSGQVAIISFDINSYITNRGTYYVTPFCIDDENIGTAGTLITALYLSPASITVLFPRQDENINSAPLIIFDVNKNSANDINRQSIRIDLNGTKSADFNYDTNCTAVDGNFHCKYTEGGLAADADNNAAFFAADSAGNNADSVQRVVHFDATAPTVSGVSAVKSGGDVAVTWSGSDTFTGIEYYYAKEDDGAWINTGLATSYAFVGSSGASHTYYAKAKDFADNNSLIVQASYSPPIVPPVIPPVGPGGGGGGGGGGVTPTPEACPTSIERSGTLSGTEVASLVERAGLSEQERAKALELAGRISVKQAIRSCVFTNAQGTRYETTVTFEVANTSGKNMGRVVLLAEVPGFIAKNASAISSDSKIIFTANPSIVKIIIPKIIAGGTGKAAYKSASLVSAQEAGGALLPAVIDFRGDYFDVVLVKIDDPVEAGQKLDFVYVVRNNTDAPGNAYIEYWLERNGEKPVKGSTTPYVLPGEEKELTDNLLLLKELLGGFDFYLQLSREGQDPVKVGKKIKIEVGAPTKVEVSIPEVRYGKEMQPTSFVIDVGSNRDEKLPITIEERLYRDGRVFWEKKQQVAVSAFEKFIEEINGLPAGKYTIEITAAYDGQAAKATKDFEIMPEVQLMPGLPTERHQVLSWLFNAIPIIILLLAAMEALLARRLFRPPAGLAALREAEKKRAVYITIAAVAIAIIFLVFLYSQRPAIVGEALVDEAVQERAIGAPGPAGFFAMGDILNALQSWPAIAALALACPVVLIFFYRKNSAKKGKTALKKN